MSELRKDPIIGRWVIISGERGRRPFAFTHEPARRGKGGFCPFCSGNEDKTPPEILAYGRNGTPPNSSGWSLRVVPNKFPALRIEGELDRQGEGLFDKMSGIGAHEVIVETPDHDAMLATLPEKRIEEVLWAYRARIVDLKNDKRFRYILIFKNHGDAAGASLEHSHSQLIALPIVPRRVREEVVGASQFYKDKERCIFCDIIRQERQAGVRVVSENDEFLAWAPYAPRFPFETWIMPKQHGAAFENAPASAYASLAKTLKDLLLRVDKLLNDPAYNYLIHTTPLHEDTGPYYHWHIEFMPRLTRVAGFEWGTGFYINPIPPEEAAQYLREVEVAVG